MNEVEVLALLKNLPDEKNLSARWDKFENHFEVTLPLAFKALVDKGIPLELFHFLFIINPFTENGEFPLENNPMLDFVKSETYLLESEFEGADDAEIVFPIGGTENAGVLLLMKKQESWHVVVADSHYYEIEYFDMGLDQFLIQFITGQLKPLTFSEPILKQQAWPLKDI